MLRNITETTKILEQMKNMKKKVCALSNYLAQVIRQMVSKLIVSRTFIEQKLTKNREFLSELQNSNLDA